MLRPILMAAGVGDLAVLAPGQTVEVLAGPEGAKAMLTQPLEVIADAVVKNNINPQPKSGRQERLENLWNRFI